jgi:hypothetical protein
VLPLSHDEVVHGKGSLLGKMPGDRWQQFANLRALLRLDVRAPGQEAALHGRRAGPAHRMEPRRELPWHLLGRPDARGVQRWCATSTTAYREPALHARDTDPHAFRWLVVDDADQSVLAFVRYGRQLEDTVVVVANFTPVVRHAYRIGLPHDGAWREVLNTDSGHYGGSNLGNRRWGARQRRQLRGVLGARRQAIELCLFDDQRQRELERLSLPECTDQVWHGYLPNAPAGPAVRTSALTGLGTRIAATASIRTSCCSIPMPGGWPAHWPVAMRCTATGLVRPSTICRARPSRQRHLMPKARGQRNGDGVGR